MTNGLGGYASGTLSARPTRGYHGLLIAALPAPLGRTIMLGHLAERLGLHDGSTASFGFDELVGSNLNDEGTGHLAEFRLEAGLPVWRYEVAGLVLEKRLVLPHLQNTVYVTYRLLSGQEPVQLVIRPLVHFRSHDAPVNTPHPGPYRLTASDEHYELASGHELPPLRMTLHGPGRAFTLDSASDAAGHVRPGGEPGYESIGDLWSPGYFRVDLKKDQEVALVASTESWEVIDALRPDEAMRAERTRRDRLLSRAQTRGG